tara:strand:+ start:284 stop:826 length:543 start_codon:yes stop_codon:yes gene_type:complete
MQYELSNLSKNNISVSKNQIFPILSLYFFALGSSLLGFSVYLFLESAGFVEKILINWNGQGLFWSFITFFASIFILFIPIEFFDRFFIENRSFKNLLANIVSVISISLFFLIMFQVLLRNQNIFVNEYLVIARAVSFSGFIAIPLLLFIFHNFGRNIKLIYTNTYGLTLIFWIIATQIFL